ncbi:MAG: sulfatase-like hydrolase/transferase [Rikenellaceae bacterium]
MITSNNTYKTMGLAALILPLTSSLFAQSEKRPNILIIFTDDQGYGDLGCMGNTCHKTPVLDQLAQDGTLFTECYAQHVSGASRSALLTGRYPLRSGGFDMPASETTFAELLKGVGYETAAVGKWDVSNRKPIEGRVPNDQGFDYYYGTLGANDGGKSQMYDNREMDQMVTDMSLFSKLYTDKAIEYLESGRDKDKPFLLYVAHTMLHSRVGVSEEYVGTTHGSLYGDALYELDTEIGRLLSKVDEMGLRDDTVIIYMTDNGPWCQYLYRSYTAKFYQPGEIYWGTPGGLRDGKGSAYEGGAKTPCIISWRGHMPEGVKKDGLMATIDFMPTFASLCGFELPSDVVIDGVDQSKFFFSKSTKSARKSYCYMQVAIPGQNLMSDFVAVRDDRWKLLIPNRQPEGKHRFMTDFGTNDYELYDLRNDSGETTNLIDKYPKEAARLKAFYEQMYKSFEPDYATLYPAAN